MNSPFVHLEGKNSSASNFLLNTAKENMNITGEEFSDFEKKFIKCYKLVAKEFKDIMRDSGEPYIVHLESTTQRTLYSPFPTPNKALTALLHDTREDIKGVSFNDIQKDTNSIVAIAVELLTKEPWEDHCNSNNPSSKQEKAAKELRNQEYLSKISNPRTLVQAIKDIAKEHDIMLKKEELKEIWDIVWNVKVADNDHNCNTLQWKSTPENIDLENIEKIDSKIDKTSKYIIPMADRVNKLLAHSLRKTVHDFKLKINGIVAANPHLFQKAS